MEDWIYQLGRLLDSESDFEANEYKAGWSPLSAVVDRKNDERGLPTTEEAEYNQRLFSLFK